MVDVGAASVSFSVKIIQSIHDAVNFYFFPISGWLLKSLLGDILFNMVVDDGSLLKFIIEAFRRIFDHGDGGFFFQIGGR